jgi:putative transposase
MDKKILDTTHKITKLYLEYCLKNQISIVYYGNLDGIAKNTKKKNSKIIGQKLSQWNHGQLIKLLENKLNKYGIKLIKVEEYYTSQKCPICKKLNKPKNRNYKCINCNYTMHRDINGAINILNDNSKYNITKYNNLKYLRIE